MPTLNKVSCILVETFFSNFNLDRTEALSAATLYRRHLAETTSRMNNRLGKSLKATIIASFSYNSFKRLANWSLEDMFFGNTFKSLRVAPPPFYNTHENIRLMSTVSYILSAPSRFWGRKHHFCRSYSID